MKAKVKYDYGWILEIPRYGNAPMLFLEWVSDFGSVEMSTEEVNNSDTFQIRFYVPKTEIQKCCDYINSNL